MGSTKGLGFWGLFCFKKDKRAFRETNARQFLIKFVYAISLPGVKGQSSWQ